MSLVSNGSLNEKTTPYIGSSSSGGVGPDLGGGPGRPRARPGGMRKDGTIRRAQPAGNAILGAGAIDIGLHGRDDGRLAGANGGMQVGDRRLFEPERLCGGGLFVHHALTSLVLAAWPLTLSLSPHAGRG